MRLIIINFTGDICFLYPTFYKYHLDNNSISFHFISFRIQMAGNFFRGTSVEQDGRWGKTDEKLMAKMEKAGNFAPILNTKVNLKKVNLDVISKWINEKIIELVGFEDDILINLVVNMLQGNEIEGKKLQLDVTGFLGKQSGVFVEELWTLMVDAMAQPNGIPSIFIQKKKEEIINRQRIASQAIKQVINIICRF